MKLSHQATSAHLDYLMSRGYLAPEDVITAFLSGSEARGWAHARSDTDLYVVYEEVPVFDESHGEPRQIDYGPAGTVPLLRRDHGGWAHTDVELWSLDQIEIVLWYAANHKWGSISAVDDFVYRLSVACPIRLPDALASFQERLSASGVFRDAAERAIGEVQELMSDSAGMLEVGDVPSAVLTARGAYAAAVDAALALEGDICPVGKWQARRVQESTRGLVDYREYCENTRLFEVSRDPDAEARELLNSCGRLLAACNHHVRA